VSRAADRVARVLRRPAGPGPQGPAPAVLDRLDRLADASTAAALRPLARHAGDRPDPVVAVLAGEAGHPLAEAVREVWPQARLIVVDPTRGTAETHVALAAAGRFDAILDAGDTNRAFRVREVFFHLAAGGAFVVVDARAVGTKVAEAAVTAVRAGLLPEGDSRPEDVRFAAAVDSVGTRGDHLLMTARPKGRPYFAKLREEEVAGYLEARGGRVGRVLLERPGSVLENPAPIRFSESVDAPTYRTRFEAPPVQLREYLGVQCRPRQVVCTDSVLLPETYRHNQRPRLGNRATVQVSTRFAQVKGAAPTEDLPGTWFHLDSEFRGHFGHALTEQLSRLWAWQEAKAAHPDAKALMLAYHARRTVGEWEYRLYEAAGVAREDLVLVDHAVRPERLLAATPMFSQPEYVHDGVRALYDRVGDHLAAEAPARDHPARIFCSRRHEKRSATNTAEVEDFFAGRGFEIVYPEDYPLAEQVQMFRAATDLAGFAGSAMFTMAFVKEAKRVTLVSSETYTAQNEAMIAAVRGHQLNVAWCRPDLTRPDGTPIPRKLQAWFTFDDAREGEFLRRVLDA
jgi:capsular polysaccharide biosynthesis protein